MKHERVGGTSQQMIASKATSEITKAAVYHHQYKTKDDRLSEPSPAPNSTASRPSSMLPNPR